MHENVKLDPRLLKLDAYSLHHGYIGETVTVELSEGTDLIGPLESVKFKQEKSSDNDKVVVVIKVGGLKKTMEVDDQVHFVSRFEPVSL